MQMCNPYLLYRAKKMCLTSIYFPQDLQLLSREMRECHREGYKMSDRG